MMLIDMYDYESMRRKFLSKIKLPNKPKEVNEKMFFETIGISTDEAYFNFKSNMLEARRNKFEKVFRRFLHMKLKAKKILVQVSCDGNEIIVKKVA